MKYYVDSRTKEVVRADCIDLSMLAPECYYEYTESPDDNVYEKWYCGQDHNGNQLQITFAWSPTKGSGERHYHFKRHNAKPQYLISYSVPSEWYKEQIEECEEQYEEERL